MRRRDQLKTRYCRSGHRRTCRPIALLTTLNQYCERSGGLACLDAFIISNKNILNLIASARWEEMVAWGWLMQEFECLGFGASQKGYS